MTRPRYATYTDEGTGIRFVFKYDEADPSLLHIYTRHLTTPEEAIRAFREGEAIWNEHHQRYESRTATHAVYWFWQVVRRVVMVISCYRKGGATWTS